MKRAALFISVILAFFIYIAKPYNALAANGVPNIDAVLVLDASNSMNASDPNKLSIEAMKMFIDMLSVSDDKVGVVSYTDQIEREKAMTTIRDAADKSLIKDFISQLKRGAYTDITMGLDEALRLMDDAHDPTHKPIIILLTDGNIELDSRKGKTLADADRDTDRIIDTARTNGYPIYTIGLNYDGNLNRNYIENIAHQTGGLCFETKTADELPDILSAIFADQMEIKIINAGQIVSDGAFQTVDVEIPDTNIIEANITFLSNNPVEIELYNPNGNLVPFDANKAILTQSNSYSLLKIISPEQGTWKLRVKGVSGDMIKINLLYNYGVDIQLDIDNPSPVAGDSVRAIVTLLEGGQPTGNAALYQNSSCEVYAVDLDQPATSFTPTSNAIYQNGVFQTDIVLPEAHTYEIRARVEHPNFFRESEPFTITVSARATTPAVNPTTTPSSPVTNPPATPRPVTNDSEEKAGISWVLIAGGVLAAIIIVVLLIVLFKQLKKSSRVFTGRLVIEVTDNYTREKSAPQYRNLIEYGRRTNLLTLLSSAGGAVSPVLSAVSIAPSPTAPSHMPQIIVKSASPQIKIKKDFMEQDATRGIAMGLKSELTVILEAENKQVKIRYTE